MDNSVQIFKALADEKRLKIIKELHGEEKCACVLIEKLEIAQSALSYHMKILCEANIIESRNEGKWTHYKINPAGFDIIHQLLNTLEGK